MDDTSTDEFANLPDEFADLQDVDWNRLLGLPQTDLPQPLARPTSPTTSSDYFVDFNLDTSLLAELDLLEQTSAASLGVHDDVPRADVPQAPTASPSSSAVPAASTNRSAGAVSTASVGSPRRRSPTPVRLPTPTKRKCPPKNCTPLKRPRSESTSPISKKKEAKRPIELEAYEEELTCPICCDIFAVAHSSNPCGHSFCGDCSWEWVMGKKSDRCPICRTKLCKTNPMIPNVVVDKLVDKHIQLLGSYDDDWTPTGHSHKEWRARIEHWRSRAPERAKVLKPPARRRRRVGVYGVASDDEYVVNMIDIFEGG